MLLAALPLAVVDRRPPPCLKVVDVAPQLPRAVVEVVPPVAGEDHAVGPALGALAVAHVGAGDVRVLLVLARVVPHPLLGVDHLALHDDLVPELVVVRQHGDVHELVVRPRLPIGVHGQPEVAPRLGVLELVVDLEPHDLLVVSQLLRAPARVDLLEVRQGDVHLQQALLGILPAVARERPELLVADAAAHVGGVKDGEDLRGFVLRPLLGPLSGLVRLRLWLPLAALVLAVVLLDCPELEHQPLGRLLELRQRDLQVLAEPLPQVLDVAVLGVVLQPLGKLLEQRVLDVVLVAGVDLLDFDVAIPLLVHAVHDMRRQHLQVGLRGEFHLLP
mmetsp:Transcript_35875/g.114039  ORF Transcript_35875/g.114039 Transcript_35875/m.114039 type:complete len:332 (-) Transcript_35875:639-1634(-)